MFQRFKGPLYFIQYTFERLLQVIITRIKNATINANGSSSGVKHKERKRQKKPQNN